VGEADDTAFQMPGAGGERPQDRRYGTVLEIF
jgi:hypothetical protein